jgi:hypothetical protein
VDSAQVRSCGYPCFPATRPDDGSEPYDCNHADTSHYNIGGEATGCQECEEAVVAKAIHDPDCGCDWPCHPEPCPFCGGDTFFDVMGGDALAMVEDMTTSDQSTRFYVGCSCWAQGPRAASEEEAVVAWNERSEVARG